MIYSTYSVFPCMFEHDGRREWKGFSFTSPSVRFVRVWLRCGWWATIATRGNSAPLWSDPTCSGDWRCSDTPRSPSTQTGRSIRKCSNAQWAFAWTHSRAMLTKRKKTVQNPASPHCTASHYKGWKTICPTCPLKSPAHRKSDLFNFPISLVTLYIKSFVECFG